MTSSVHAADASSLLTPEVLAQICEAVMKKLDEQERRRRQQESDLKIDRRASKLD